MSWITAMPAFVFGLAAGSFLNVVIYRLPLGRSVVRPRSACPACGRTLRWFENVPVLSFVLLRGRCRSCGAAISPRYPVVELLGGFFALLALWIRGGDPVGAAFVYTFLMALLAVAMIDWDHRIIPDEISLPLLAAGLAWSLVNPALGPLSSVAGALAGGGSLWLVGAAYRRLRGVEGMGGGDVKLMAMIGAWLGLGLVLPVIVLASFFGSLYGVSLMRRGGDGRTEVAFGSFLAPAAGVCLVCGQAILGWYLGRFGI
ncbi:MAG: prepilin peptidase [Candidatus Krumholzibacteria bacterium]|nr:prepilin peptidase [Candidatus Krumholzibacteria bacterium]